MKRYKDIEDLELKDFRKIATDLDEAYLEKKLNYNDKNLKF